MTEFLKDVSGHLGTDWESLKKKSDIFELALDDPIDRRGELKLMEGAVN